MYRFADSLDPGVFYLEYGQYIGVKIRGDVDIHVVVHGKLRVINSIGIVLQNSTLALSGLETHPNIVRIPWTSIDARSII